MPSVEQVLGTLPPSFKEKYPNTYAIIDGSEIFIETPYSRHYSRHPGVIITQRSFCLHAHQMERCVSFLHYNVGSISDVQLTTQQLTTQLKKRYPDNGR